LNRFGQGRDLGQGTLEFRSLLLDPPDAHVELPWISEPHRNFDVVLNLLDEPTRPTNSDLQAIHGQ
jgi:hypothetical protein